MYIIDRYWLCKMRTLETKDTESNFVERDGVGGVEKCKYEYEYDVGFLVHNDIMSSHQVQALSSHQVQAFLTQIHHHSLEVSSFQYYSVICTNVAT